MPLAFAGLEGLFRSLPDLPISRRNLASRLSPMNAPFLKERRLVKPVYIKSQRLRAVFRPVFDPVEASLSGSGQRIGNAMGNAGLRNVQKPPRL